MFSRSKKLALYTEMPVKEEKSLLALLLPSRIRPSVPAKWPNPEASVGKRCCKIGELTFWEIQDPGRANLAPLKEEIQKFLNDELLNESSKRTGAVNLAFDVFMVGRNEEESNPTLVIISADRGSRSKVVNSIRKKGIVEKYEGVMLGVSSIHPRYSEAGPVEWTAKEKGKGNDIELPQDRESTPLAASQILEKEKNGPGPPAQAPEEAHAKALLASNPPGSSHKTTQDTEERGVGGSDQSAPEKGGRDKDRRAQEASARMNEYFVPKSGIDREVISADICRYLGNDAMVRPGAYEVYSILVNRFAFTLKLSFRIPKRGKFS